ncbi:MAG: hypothetical protein P9M06_02010 [Candidatus Saelkia tenebricola]|nr:hypothetical protein [Candidatus Saelkia tenebricola]
MFSRFLVCVLIATFILSGCATTSRRGSTVAGVSNELEVSALLKFDDIPVPNGFNFIAVDSFAFQTQDIRVGLLKYEGKANPDEVVQFYKEQMPLYNWKTINLIEYERRILNFEKDGQSAVITIDAKGGKSALVIAVSPRSDAGIFEK